jgi:hypothetical protein
MCRKRETTAKRSAKKITAREFVTSDRDMDAEPSSLGFAS